MATLISAVAVDGFADELEARASLKFGNLINAYGGRVLIDTKDCMATVVTGATTTINQRNNISQCAEFAVVDSNGRPSRKAYRLILPREATITNPQGQTVIVTDFTHNLVMDTDGYTRKPYFLLGGTVILPNNLRPSHLTGPISIGIEFKDQQ